jgi:succinyl-CoA synthetase beta subunit
MCVCTGLIRAVQTLNIKKPLVVRLAGTNVKEAHQLIEDSGLRMLAATDLGDAAKKAVKVANIVELAEDSGLHVDFELPL